MDVLHVLELLTGDSKLRTKAADFCWHPIALTALPLAAAVAAWLAVSSGTP